MEISHDGHQHTLALQSAKHPYYCKGCDQLGFRQSYTCNTDNCNFFLHEKCGNPQSGRVRYPFSTKCFLKFVTKGSGQGSLCDVCGNKIKGYHYRCLCNFQKRNVHPFCLHYEKTLVAADGMTLNLKKEAPEKCLHCERKYVTSKVRGWAYVSSCGEYCYHVACVMNIINSKWRNGLNENFDPTEIIKQEFPADHNKRQQLVAGNNNSRTSKKVTMVLSVMFNLLTGNPAGLIGDATSYFRK